MGDVYKETADIPTSLRTEVQFYCPASGCENNIQISKLDDFSCPECGTGFVIKIVDDVLIPSVRRKGVTGYMMVVEMPELPRERRKRFIEDYDLHNEQASKLTISMEVADFYEDLTNIVAPETAASFIADDLIGELHYRNQTIEKVDSNMVTGLITAVDNDDITRKSAVTIVREALDDDRPIDDVFSEKDVQKTDDKTLRKVVQDVAQSESEAVQDYLDGEDEAINYLVGQVMSRTDGQADAEDARNLIVSEINES